MVNPLFSVVYGQTPRVDMFKILRKKGGQKNIFVLSCSMRQKTAQFRIINEKTNLGGIGLETALSFNF